LIAVYYKKKGDISPKAKQIAVFMGLVFLIFLPWLLKNLYFTGDPVYPYLASLTPEKAYLKKFIAVTREYFTSLKAYLVHPWSLTMEGNSNASFIGPIFLLFAPLLLFFKNKDRVTKILLIYLAGFWFIWSLATHMLRFFIPALPVFSILIAVYVWRADLGKVFRAVSLTLVGLLCLINLYWLSSILYNREGWQVVSGKLSKEQYLSYPHIAYGVPYYKMAEYINKNLPANAKILLVGEGRSYYIQRKVLTSSVYDQTPVVEWTKSSGSSEGVFLAMRKEHITHIMLNKPEALRLQKSYQIFYFNERELQIFNEFWKKYLRFLYHTHNIYLFELVSAG
ncbi:MAG: hypothetical protein V1653_04775, partial [bacterium]